MKRAIGWLLPVSLLCVAVCSTVRPQGSEPTVSDILAKYVNALGGRAAITKLTSRVTKGTLQLSGMEQWGSVESYAKAPNKYYSLIVIPGFGEIRRGFDGHSGWVQRPDTGLAGLEGQELSSMQRAADFYQAAELPKLYSKMTLKGKEDVASYPAYVIEADPGDGTLRRMFFDVSSGLMVRSDEELDTAQGRVATQTYLEDYRDVEGVKQPFSIRQVNGAATLLIKLTDVRVNQPVDDAKFAKPTQ